MTDIKMWMLVAAIIIWADIAPARAVTSDSLACSLCFLQSDGLLSSADTHLPSAATHIRCTLPTDSVKYPQPLFALKTNLLFDAASILNVALEVPIGRRWSVAGEWIFPWWLWTKKQYCLQALSGNVEGKYWFGNRQTLSDGKPRPLLTGWFAGFYAGGGYYDLEWNKEGYQGEFFIAAGLSAGYAHTLSKSGNLRMEYSLGIGYLQTRYRKYNAELGADEQWHLYRKSSGRYTWIGPTRACVSLVWIINSKKKARVAR